MTYDLSLLPERIRSKIQVNAESGCWEWLRALDKQGYGIISLQNKNYKAHRVVWTRLVGKPHVGPLDHVCARWPGADRIEARRCVNPEHLDPVTTKINVLLSESPSAKNARKTHCKRNHELFGENLRRHPNGSRLCRQCCKEQSRKDSRIFRKKNPEICRAYERKRSEEHRKARTAYERARYQLKKKVAQVQEFLQGAVA